MIKPHIFKARYSPTGQSYWRVSPFVKPYTTERRKMWSMAYSHAGKLNGFR